MVAFVVNNGRVQFDLSVLFVPVVRVEYSTIDLVCESVFGVNKFTRTRNGVVGKPLRTDDRCLNVASIHRFCRGGNRETDA